MIPKLGVGKNLQFINRWMFILRLQKMSQLWGTLTFQPKRMCYLIFRVVRVLFIGSCRHASYMGVSYRSPSWKNGN